MKDLPHHLKKLNRNIIRSARATEEELPDVPVWPDSERQKRKKAKIRMKNQENNHPILKDSPEERNKILKKGRSPIFDRHHTPVRHAAPSKKKTPKI